MSTRKKPSRRDEAVLLPCRLAIERSQICLSHMKALLHSCAQGISPDRHEALIDIANSLHRELETGARVLNEHS